MKRDLPLRTFHNQVVSTRLHNVYTFPLEALKIKGIKVVLVTNIEHCCERAVQFADVASAVHDWRADVRLYVYGYADSKLTLGNLPVISGTAPCYATRYGTCSDAEDRKCHSFRASTFAHMTKHS